MAADPEQAELVRRRMDLDAAARRVRKELRAASLEVVELPMLFTAAVGKAQVSQLSRCFNRKAAA